MDFSDDELRAVFKKGRCYRCMKPLWFGHFGRRESPWGWYVEKSFDRMSGEIDLRHSHPCCYSCIKQKRGKTSERDRRLGGSRNTSWWGR